MAALEALEADYEFVRHLGSGGMADVYLAHDRVLGREVAIKVIRSALLRDAEAAARLVREARTVARLNHPGIVTLYAARPIGANGLALVMAYCAGGTLRDLLRRQPQLPLDEALRIVGEVAAALDHAHAQGVVHRDVKPENIFFDGVSGRALLADFGIATAAGEATLTVTGSAIGTPQYMAPEQIRGEDVDGRADQYALGCVLWECLAGAQPWAGESLWSVVAKQESTPLPDVRTVRSDASVAVAVALSRAVAKPRDERWGTCGEFVRSLASDTGAEWTLDAPSVPNAQAPAQARPRVSTRVEGAETLRRSRHSTTPSSRQRASAIHTRAAAAQGNSPAAARSMISSVAITVGLLVAVCGVWIWRTLEPDARGIDTSYAGASFGAASAIGSPNAAPSSAVGTGAAIDGRAEYLVCGTCHQENGEGLPNLYPPLAGSEWLTGDPAIPIAIVLHGMQGEIMVRGARYNNGMAPWASLRDEQIAAILTYARSSWGNRASAVSAAQVAEVRAATAGRTTHWTPEEVRAATLR
jgi:serine/threonine protein kinase